MLSYLEILRMPNAAMSVVATVLTALIVGFYDPVQIALASLAVFLISGAGMVINDYFDLKADAINRPKRPIPSGRISRRSAMIYAAMLFAAGNATALFLNLGMFTIAAINTALLIAYAMKVKRIPLAGNLVVGYTSASIFLFASLLSGSITYTVIILFVLAFSASIGREVAKAIEDMEGDRKAGARTLPVALGRDFSAWVSISFIIMAVLFSPLPYVLGLLSINYVYAVIVTDAVFMAACFTLMFSPKKSQRLMKVGMFMALLSFLAGTF